MYPHEFGLAEPFAHRRQDRAKIGHVSVGRPSRGGPGQESLQCVAHLLDLECFPRRDQPDAGTPMRLADDEPFLIQHREGRADGRAPRAVSNGEIRLDQPLVGLELAADDRLPEAVARTDHSFRR